MEENNMHDKLGHLIQASMELDAEPSPELNNKLKVRLYSREASARKEALFCSISLWYVPMVLNFITFSSFAILALMAIANPYLSVFIAIACGYIAVAGILITVLGVKRTDIKKDITIHIQKRSVSI